MDVANARPYHPARSETPDMPGNSKRENRETPAAPAVGEAAGRKENAISDESFVHAAGESHDCTSESSEQRSERVGGGAGGKAVDQGEHQRAQPESNTESRNRVTGA